MTSVRELLPGLPWGPAPESDGPARDWVAAAGPDFGHFIDGAFTAPGPERIETGWWDGHDVRRDYYVALSRAGVRLWIFRERPPGQRWFLHGVFG